LNGLDQLRVAEFWRHSLHWFGGLGIIVMALAVLPLLGPLGGISSTRAGAGAVKTSGWRRGIPRPRDPVARVCRSSPPRALRRYGSAAWVVRAVSMLLGGGTAAFPLTTAASRLRLPGDRAGADRADADRVVELRAPLHRAAAPVARELKADPEVQGDLRVLAVSVVRIAVLLTRDGVMRISHRATPLGVQRRSQATPAASPARISALAGVRAYWMLFLSCIVCSTGSTGGGIKMFRRCCWRARRARS